MSEENDAAKNSEIKAILWFSLIIIALVIFAGIKNKPDGFFTSKRAILLKACENDLKDNLKSPGSYKLVKKSVIAGGETQFITIEYDAQNGYGALLRGEYRCTFDKDGILTRGHHM